MMDYWVKSQYPVIERRVSYSIAMNQINLEICYLYRDATNHKQCQSVIIANPGGRSTDEVRAALLGQFRKVQCWPDIPHFKPERLGWPTAYFDDHDERLDDINVHELDEIVPTDQPITLTFDLERLLNST